MRTAILAAGLLALTGCVSDETTGGERPTEPSPSAEISPAPSESPDDSPDEAAPCEETMFQRAQNTIRSQQRAFANDDFAVARGYASQSFQGSVSVDQFQSIIEGTYAFLLDDPAVEFLDCQRLGETALIRVEISGSPIVTMAYRVVLENESWFIDAATVAGTREAVTA